MGMGRLMPACASGPAAPTPSGAGSVRGALLRRDVRHFGDVNPAQFACCHRAHPRANGGSAVPLGADDRPGGWIGVLHASDFAGAVGKRAGSGCGAHHRATDDAARCGLNHSGCLCVEDA